MATVPTDPPDGYPENRRNLPGRYIDAIRDGLPGTPSRKQVMSALGSSALSAVQRGWTAEQWCILLTGEEVPSRLAYQYRTTRKKRPATLQELRTALDRIWINAERYAAMHPPAYTETAVLDVLTEIREAAFTSGLGASDRIVLAAILDIAEVNATTTPTLPRRQVADHAGTGDRTTRNSLRRLVDAGWLTVVEPGKSGRPIAGKPGMATIYRLGNPFAIPRSKRQMGGSQVGFEPRAGGPRGGPISTKGVSSVVAPAGGPTSTSFGLMPTEPGDSIGPGTEGGSR